MRKQQKEAKYSEACRVEGIEFFALPVKTTDTLEEGATAIITKLGKAMALTTCWDEAEVTIYLFGKLSILLTKTNASMILNRVPP